MSFKQEVIDSQKELNILSKKEREIIVKAKYGLSPITKIPLILNDQLSYIVAAIIGDGHLNKAKFRTVIDCFNKNQIESFQKISNNLFDRKFVVSQWTEKGKPRYRLVMNGKSIQSFLNKVFEVPLGKKSNIVKIPEHIKNSDNSIKCAFLQGIMDTEGGNRKRGVGLSTSSKQLWNELVSLFDDVGIKAKTDRWVHKRYKKEYYGLYFRKEDFQLIVRGCQSGQMGDV